MRGFLGLAREPEGGSCSILPCPASPLALVCTPDPRATLQDQAVLLCQATGRTGATSFRKTAPAQPGRGPSVVHFIQRLGRPIRSEQHVEESRHRDRRSSRTPIDLFSYVRAPLEVITLFTDVEGRWARPGRAAGVCCGWYQM